MGTILTKIEMQQSFRTAQKGKRGNRMEIVPIRICMYTCSYVALEYSCTLRYNQKNLV